MAKLKYFPFGLQFEMRIGTALFRDVDRLVEADENYAAEIALKRASLEADHKYYFRGGPETEPAQWDILEAVLTDLSRFDSESFGLERNGTEWRWSNRKLGEEFTFQRGKTDTLPLEPLDWVGRQVQEDLIILSGDGSASVVGGQLCFANGWSLAEKFGQSLMQVHTPAPKLIRPMLQGAQKMMEHIGERPLWRASWNFKITGQHDLSSRHTEEYKRQLAILAPMLTPENIGSQVYIRIERQTLSRLLPSNTILFGIHLHQNRLDDERLTRDQTERMLNVLRTSPREMLAYKAITPFESALLGYLERRL